MCIRDRLPTRTSAYAKVTNETVKAFEPVMKIAVERAWIPEGGKLFGPLDNMATAVIVQGADVKAVSYTHLDVYKRQTMGSPTSCRLR